MKKFTKKQMIISVSLILLIFIMFYFIYGGWLGNNELLENQHYIALRDEQMGVMRASEAAQIQEIVAKIQKTGSISDDDLEWLLGMLKKNSDYGQPQEIARASILAPLEELKSIPSQQKEKIYQAVILMLGDETAYNDELDKIRASAIMKILKDKRAVPYLVPLLTAKEDNNDGQLHLHAQEALDAIGYKSN